jgi:hypothetical protein
VTTPQPPIAAEVDLRDFAYMPLDVRRLLTSETWVLGRAEEKVAAINLWCEAWHQVPCGSLPDNERMLAHLSQAGAGWKKVRAHAMRGWVLCSDGRWYHPVIVEKALESWARKVAQRQRTQRASQARWKGKPDPTDPSGITPTPPKDPAPSSVTSSVTETPTESVTDSVTETPTESVTDSVTESVTESKGWGRDGERISALASASRARGSTPVELAVEARRLGIETHGSHPTVIALAEQGTTTETLRAAVEDIRRRKPGQPVSIGYVAGTLAGWARDAAGLRVVGAAPPGARGGVTDEQLAELQARLEAEERDAAA